MARPKTTMCGLNGKDLVAEEKSCGYIMHQVRSIRCKMRWGELTLGKNDRDVNWCQISLYKFDLVNPKLGTLAKKDLRLKASFFFSEDDFCGLEKGQHRTKHGAKRYICIILKDQHVIFQDAIIAMTDANHDVIQTWYKKITNSMHYMYRWKILSFNEERFLHVSKLNTSVCLSLHNSNEGLKGKILLQKQYITRMIERVEEQQERQSDGSPCTRVVLFIRDNFEKVCFILEAGKSLSDVINNTNRTNPLGFDFLGYQNPNLVKIQREPKKEEPTKSLKQLLDRKKSSNTNTYVPNTVDLPNKNCDFPPSSVANGNFDSPLPDVRWGSLAADRVPRHSPLENASYRPQLPHLDPLSMAHRHSDAPPRVPPRDPTDDIKKVSDTRATFDSGFHTSNYTHTANSTDTQFSNSSETDIANDDYNSPELNAHALSPSNNQLPADPLHLNSAPELPPRDIPVTVPTNHSVDLIERALRNQSLPPLDANPQARLPGYENHLSIEVTIDLVLHRNHGDNIDVTLGLPHSAYLAILLGLENNTVGDGDWRGLASALAMSFENVMQIEAATQHREQLYPAHIVLVHWLRTQAPYPFTRLSLRRILQYEMNRLDLANLIPSEDEKNRQI